MYLVIPLNDSNTSVSAPLGVSLIRDLPDKIDFIEAITGIPNLNTAWNEYKLRPEMVQKVSHRFPFSPAAAL
jgi:hypothetical protein